MLPQVPLQEFKEPLGVTVAVAVGVAFDVAVAVAVGVAVALGVGVEVGLGLNGHAVIFVVQDPPTEGQQYSVPAAPQVAVRPAVSQRLSSGDPSVSPGWQFLRRFGWPGAGQASTAGHWPDEAFS